MDCCSWGGLSSWNGVDCFFVISYSLVSFLYYSPGAVCMGRLVFAELMIFFVWEAYAIVCMDVPNATCHVCDIGQS